MENLIVHQIFPEGVVMLLWEYHYDAWFVYNPQERMWEDLDGRPKLTASERITRAAQT